MIKQIIVLIGASVLAVLFKTELGHVLQVMLDIYDHVLSFLSVIFSDDKLGMLVQHVISLFVIPFILGILLSLIYWIAKRSQMPYLAEIVWVVWIVLATLLIVQETSVIHHSYVLNGINECSNI